MVYCDETAEEGSSVNIHQPTTFAHKNLILEGASVFWDEFSDAMRASLKSSPTQSVSLFEQLSCASVWVLLNVELVN